MLCALGMKTQTSFNTQILRGQVDVILADAADLHLFCSRRGQTQNSCQLHRFHL